ncbi:PilZ domain-containing protein [Elusimicrobiota bacterium]
MKVCKTKKKTSEKRRCERHPANFTLDLSKSKGPAKGMQASVVDISNGGMAFETSKKIDVGSFMSIGLNAPFRVHGDIAYCRVYGKKYRYGLRFHHVYASPGMSRFLRIKAQM